jgi:hypothetical protein
MRLSGLTVISFALMLVSALARKNQENPRTLKNAVRRSLSSSQTFVYLAAILANLTKGLFIWAKVIPVSEKTFRQVYERDLALLRK